MSTTVDALGSVQSPRKGALPISILFLKEGSVAVGKLYSVLSQPSQGVKSRQPAVKQASTAQICLAGRAGNGKSRKRKSELIWAASQCPLGYMKH